MEIYLVRHTKPDIDSGICYGQADIDVAETFEEEATAIKKLLPADIQQLYCSPLNRCKKLAQYIFPERTIEYADELKEMYFGEWELQSWDAIAQEPLNTWMQDFVNVRVPGGENYLDLHARTIQCFESIIAKKESAIVFSHAGNIRSILSYLNNIPLNESFSKFKVEYGAVIKTIS
ncbi:MAG: alpha-ribazole phosphatase [Bacteroidota bacterium]|jgi:alpha-ribazole phosphatase